MGILNNLGIKGPEFHDYVIKNGVMEPLLTLARSSTNELELVSNVITNLCTKPWAPIEVVRMCIPTLLELTRHTDKEVVGKLLNKTIVGYVRRPKSSIIALIKV